METSVKFDIKEIAWPGKTFVTRRARVGFDNLTAFFSKSYGAIYTAIQKQGWMTADPPCAIYYSVDEAKYETDLAAAVPVTDPANELEGFDMITIPPAKALLLTHYGSYETMNHAYAALEKYMADHNLQKEWMLEEYFTDPSVEKDPAKWKTNIYFLVK